MFKLISEEERKYDVGPGAGCDTSKAGSRKWFLTSDLLAAD